METTVLLGSCVVAVLVFYLGCCTGFWLRDWAGPRPTPMRPRIKEGGYQPQAKDGETLRNPPTGGSGVSPAPETMWSRSDFDDAARRVLNNPPSWIWVPDGRYKEALQILKATEPKSTGD